MKKNAVLVNVTCGEVVNETALLEALENDGIKAAAIDVYENELTSKSKLIDNDKIFPAPYLGALTVEGRDRAGLQVVSVLKEFFNV
jgi:D-3-phosphoglycerate dehydrogenase